MLSKEDFDSIITGAKDKLDTQSQAIISEDLLNIMSNYSIGIDELNKRDTEIDKLKKDNEELLKVNGKLFQKIGFEKEEPQYIQPKQNIEEIKISDIINERGEFIK